MHNLSSLNLVKRHSVRLSRPNLFDERHILNSEACGRTIFGSAHRFQDLLNNIRSKPHFSKLRRRHTGIAPERPGKMRRAVEAALCCDLINGCGGISQELLSLAQPIEKQILVGCAVGVVFEAAY